MRRLTAKLFDICLRSLYIKSFHKLLLVFRRLPNYQKKSTLRDKLRYAITSNTGFELS